MKEKEIRTMLKVISKSKVHVVIQKVGVENREDSPQGSTSWTVLVNNVLLESSRRGVRLFSDMQTVIGWLEDSGVSNFSVNLKAVEIGEVSK
jgi:hypothetical protein